MTAGQKYLTSSEKILTILITTEDWQADVENPSWGARLFSFGNEKKWSLTNSPDSIISQNIYQILYWEVSKEDLD